MILKGGRKHSQENQHGIKKFPATQRKSQKITEKLNLEQITENKEQILIVIHRTLKTKLV